MCIRDRIKNMLINHNEARNKAMFSLVSWIKCINQVDTNVALTNATAIATMIDNVAGSPSSDTPTVTKVNTINDPNTVKYVDNGVT